MIDFTKFFTRFCVLKRVFETILKKESLFQLSVIHLAKKDVYLGTPVHSSTQAGLAKKDVYLGTPVHSSTQAGL